MDYYIDIELKPDAEMRLNVLLNNVYAKFHKALCDLSSTSIGVSFPKYQITLGSILRIHGDHAALNELQGLKWLGGVSGYCSVSEILEVPNDAKHRVVSRIQSTMSQSKLNRLVKRGTISDDDAKRYKAKIFSKGLSNPYLELVSSSNGQKHRRYIDLGEILAEPIEGDFDQFGLSKTATVPWF